ncbi:hypothetical protein [Carboxylicivirga sp. RSCT41]|uniref:hypothetical protein n=1 Tax=Carboxylicivirga agarovorans TaxID=3417570 RepID=UPI003D344D4B
MGLFKKSKKSADCCTIKFEEIKEKQSGKDKGCCEFQIEERLQVIQKDEKKKGCRE